MVPDGCVVWGGFRNLFLFRKWLQVWKIFARFGHSWAVITCFFLPFSIFSHELLGPDGKTYETGVRGLWGGHQGAKVFGRMDCPSALSWIARGHYTEGRVFFGSFMDAMAAGFRPCQRCLKGEYFPPYPYVARLSEKQFQEAVESYQQAEGFYYPHFNFRISMKTFAALSSSEEDELSLPGNLFFNQRVEQKLLERPGPKLIRVFAMNSENPHQSLIAEIRKIERLSGIGLAQTLFAIDHTAIPRWVIKIGRREKVLP